MGKLNSKSRQVTGRAVHTKARPGPLDTVWHSLGDLELKREGVGDRGNTWPCRHAKKCVFFRVGPSAIYTRVLGLLSCNGTSTLRK